jgi:hypothetical protein
MILTNSPWADQNLERYDQFNAFHSETLDGGAAKRFREIMLGMTAGED